ncbi:MarR family winged helix-turn-helix transcriptional regulator [Svornostia abyssi]|uniref:MarR family winged helix-turn-helix transcriptional regulator n=1 Tax=Svornostia abyssi TaxID=2898438 RepID=A0ABY5PIY7_9ACTN|nr:MarR family winged helix-turn-helix transcriptional regulator [Parviterribacteraceae bacterium J379]
MSTSTPPARLHIGQLLVQLTRVFQEELFARLVEAGLTDARVAHTHVTAYIKADGSRLTELAAQARMTLPAMSELVDDLQRLGIVERRRDPTDGRAKLICLTDAGWEAMGTARRAILAIEEEYADQVGADRFEAAAQTLDELLRALSAEQPRRDTR